MEFPGLWSVLSVKSHLAAADTLDRDNLPFHSIEMNKVKVSRYSYKDHRKVESDHGFHQVSIWKIITALLLLRILGRLEGHS